MNLPSDCALIAVSACYQLARSGIECKALAVTYQRKPLSRHIIVIFAFEDRLRAYDSDGSVTLSKNLTFKSLPTKIAADWVKNLATRSTTFPFKALKGEWY